MFLSGKNSALGPGKNLACFAAVETYFPRMSVLETTNKKSAVPRATSSHSESNFLAHPDQFPRRHIGPEATQTKEMLSLVGRPTLDALIDDTVPKQIRLP